ncbi:MAG: CCA tRNA nucleotidyltransferase [Hyphomicrobiales bacterium]|nr:CCA tRNA nucleotidyltransferase [Hyphomicrobiales bacterium]MCP5000383.1 CCA tRNA nucleotidyltransferase [Hyphomicrobiales bacterium]
MSNDAEAASIAGAKWFGSRRLHRVLDLLNADGGEARIVGGAVRNTLMGVPVGDIDIATTLLPAEVVARAKGAGIKSVPTGIDHGTVTLVVDGSPFEVTTLRVDVEAHGRHATVAFGADWSVDAHRRDLTMNGLYAGADGKVIDLVGGLADIESKTVRFIGDAVTRIEEDYLRILRFFRFFARYGEGRPDADGLRACARLKAGLEGLSAERVWTELKYLLASPDPSRALLWMRQTGVLTAIVPESEKWGIDAIPGLVETETALNWNPDPLLRLMAIIPNDSARADAMAQRLRMSNAERKRMVSWAGEPAISDDLADVALKRLLYRGDPQAVTDTMRLQLRARRTAAQTDDAALHSAAKLSRLLGVAEGWARPGFPVTGGDLLKAGVAEGPAIGDTLGALEEAWIDSNFNLTREQLLERVKE